MTRTRQDYQESTEINHAPLTLLLAFLLITLSIAGCASTRAHKTESLLSAAGFHTFMPNTPQQEVCYAALPGFKMQRRQLNGKAIYAYADKRAGRVYVGNEEQYQRFRELAERQRMAEKQFQAAQMNQTAIMNWGFYSAPGASW